MHLRGQRWGAFRTPTIKRVGLNSGGDCGFNHCYYSKGLGEGQITHFKRSTLLSIDSSIKPKDFKYWTKSQHAQKVKSTFAGEGRGANKCFAILSISIFLSTIFFSLTQNKDTSTAETAQQVHIHERHDAPACTANAITCYNAQLLPVCAYPRPPSTYSMQCFRICNKATPRTHTKQVHLKPA